jgi:hypothetical protein
MSVVPLHLRVVAATAWPYSCVITALMYAIDCPLYPTHSRPPAASAHTCGVTQVQSARTVSSAVSG